MSWHPTLDDLERMDDHPWRRPRRFRDNRHLDTKTIALGGSSNLLPRPKPPEGPNWNMRRRMAKLILGVIQRGQDSGEVHPGMFDSMGGAGFLMNRGEEHFAVLVVPLGCPVYHSQHEEQEN